MFCADRQKVEATAACSKALGQASAPFSRKTGMREARKGKSGSRETACEEATAQCVARSVRVYSRGSATA